MYHKNEFYENAKVHGHYHQLTVAVIKRYRGTGSSIVINSSHPFLVFELKKRQLSYTLVSNTVFLNLSSTLVPPLGVILVC